MSAHLVGKCQVVKNNFANYVPAMSYLHHSKMLFLWWVRIYFQASVLYFFALFHLSPSPVSFLWGEGRPEFNGLNSSSSSSSPSSYFFASSHTTNLSPKPTPIPVKSLSADSPAQTGKGLIEMERELANFLRDQLRRCQGVT